MNSPNHWRWVVAWAAALLLVTAWRGSALGQESAAAGPVSADTPEVHLGKGYDALKQDMYEVAAGEFRAALQLDPSLVLRARFPLAIALFELHKYDEARRELEIVQHEAGD